MPMVSLEAELGFKPLAYLDIPGFRRELVFLSKAKKEGDYQEIIQVRKELEKKDFAGLKSNIFEDKR